MLTYPLVIGTWELVALVFVILLVFGGKKIPELMRGVGKGVKSFKEGLNDIEDDVRKSGTETSAGKKDTDGSSDRPSDGQ